MQKEQEQYRHILHKYLPENSIDLIFEWILTYKVQLHIKKVRTTKLGDYRIPQGEQGHRITINHNLNPYAFLITLVHEIAHLICWEKFKTKVKPHGKEWKTIFKSLMHHFIFLAIFPDDIHNALLQYMSNPYASSCTDVNLYKVLKKYDKEQTIIYLEDIPISSLFTINNQRHFKKGEKLRKRYKCLDLNNKKHYLISPLAEVQLL